MIVNIVNPLTWPLTWSIFVKFTRLSDADQEEALDFLRLLERRGTDYPGQEQTGDALAEIKAEAQRRATQRRSAAAHKQE